MLPQRDMLKRDMLASDDVYLIDSGRELLVWVGGYVEGLAEAKSAAAAFNTASAYLRQSGQAITTPVTLIREGQEGQCELFRSVVA